MYTMQVQTLVQAIERRINYKSIEVGNNKEFIGLNGMMRINIGQHIQLTFLTLLFLVQDIYSLYFQFSPSSLKWFIRNNIFKQKITNMNKYTPGYYQMTELKSHWRKLCAVNFGLKQVHLFLEVLMIRISSPTKVQYKNFTSYFEINVLKIKQGLHTRKISSKYLN